MTYLLLLLACQLAGECLQRFLHLVLPGPVVGMFLLTLILLIRGGRVPAGLQTTAGVLLANFGLLFVPAGVGVIAHLDLIREQWAPIVVGVVGSSILSVLATAMVMQWFERSPAADPPEEIEAAAMLPSTAGDLSPSSPESPA